MMNQWISPFILEALSHTILHSLWQGAIIGLISYLLLQRYKSDSSRRYHIAMSGIITMGICTLITFATFGMKLDTAAQAPHSEVFLLNNIQFNASSSNSTPHYWLAYIWMVGVALLLVKLIADILVIQYIKKTANSNAIEDRFSNLLNKVRNDLKIKKHVRLMTSHIIDAPITVGWIKPIVLFPIGMLNQLSIEEVESILAHELAHILRHDYIFNIIQSVVEVILFYHPALWYLSKIAREEREYHCDDIALSRKNQKIAYAKTLVKIQELKMNNKLALSFADQSLLNRIQRIMNTPKSKSKMKGRLIASLFVLCLVAFMSKELFAKNIENVDTPIEKEITFTVNSEQDIANKKIVEVTASLDTFPSTKTTSRSTSKTVISQSGDDGDIVLTEEDGEIKELKINGRVIPKEDYDNYQSRIDDLGGGITIHSDIIEFDGEGSVFHFNGDSIVILDSESLEEFSKDMAEWGEQFGENFAFTFGDRMENWGENFGEELGQSFEVWGEKIGEDMDIWIEKWSKDFEDDSLNIRHFSWPDSNRMRGFVFPNDMNEVEMHEELEKMLEGLQLENLDMQNLLETLPQLGESDIQMFQLDLDDLPKGYSFPERFFEGGRSFTFPQGQGLNFGNKTVEDKIGYELRKDRIITPGEKSEIELTGKHMKINGDKQPKNIWQKYKSIFEEASGIELSKDSKLKFEVMGKRTLKKSKSI